MPTPYQAKIRDKLLKQYAPDMVESDGPPPREYLAWEDDPVNPAFNKHKTLAMRLVESHFGKPIEVLISMDQKGGDVARRLGFTPGCITRWRQRLGLSQPYSKEKLASDE